MVPAFFNAQKPKPANCFGRELDSRNHRGTRLFCLPTCNLRSRRGEEFVPLAGAHELTQKRGLAFMQQRRRRRVLRGSPSRSNKRGSQANIPGIPAQKAAAHDTGQVFRNFWFGFAAAPISPDGLAPVRRLLRKMESAKVIGISRLFGHAMALGSPRRDKGHCGPNASEPNLVLWRST